MLGISTSSTERPNMLRIFIANMNCGGCAKAVRATLSEAAPGAEVTVDLQQREVTVASPDAAPLLAALLADGWKATAVPD
jgi:copper chaperone